MDKKQTYILTTLCFLTVTSNIHKYFEGMGRINPFLFYDYYNSCGVRGISVSIFVYELSYMFEFLVLLSLTRYLLITKRSRNIMSPFIWIALIDIIDYICICKQLSYYKLPMLIVLIFIYNRKWILKSDNIWTGK